jgi:5-oxoprolinase (ATP-hydrolysing) subunit A
MRRSIDLNCDMGESFGAFTIGNDEVLMEYVSSVNIACGFHAGDPGVMRATIARAASRDLAIGAHPGYPDLQGFGRREMKMSLAEVYDCIVYQVGALLAFAKVEGARINHVKPHGALYNSAAKDRALAATIARSVHDVDKDLALVGLSGSCLIEEGDKAGLRTCNEAFADRTYQEDGTLVPRSAANAIIHDAHQAALQILQIVQRGTVTTVNGKEIAVRADTVCIHGDGHQAIEIAKAITNILRENNVSIKSF